MIVIAAGDGVEEDAAGDAIAMGRGGRLYCLIRREATKEVISTTNLSNKMHKNQQTVSAKYWGYFDRNGDDVVRSVATAETEWRLKYPQCFCPAIDDHSTPQTITTNCSHATKTLQILALNTKFYGCQSERSRKRKERERQSGDGA